MRQRNSRKCARSAGIRREVVWLAIVAVGFLVAGCSRIGSWRQAGTAPSNLVASGGGAPSGAETQTGEHRLADLLRDPGRRDLALHLGERAVRDGRTGEAEALLTWALGVRVEPRPTGGRRAVGRTGPVERPLDPRQRSRARTLLAALALERGDYSGAHAHADAAVVQLERSGSTDQAGRDAALRIQGRARLGLADYHGAIAAFAGVVGRLDEQDFDLRILARRGVGDYHGALETIAERLRRFGYAPGQGVEESLLHEWVGRADRAVAAALMETEYVRYHHDRPPDAIETALTAVAASLDPADSPSAVGIRLIHAYRALLSESWNEARETLISVAGVVDHPFVYYLLLVSRLLDPPVDPALVRDFLTLEPLFGGTQFYHSRLWRSLSARYHRGELPSYSLLTMRELLERTITLAPRSTEARAARGELLRLSGGDPRDADRLLLPAEIDSMVEEAVRTRTPLILTPVVEALSLPESPYLWAAMLGLRRVSGLPAVREFLTHAREHAQPDSVSRIDRVLFDAR